MVQIVRPIADYSTYNIASGNYASIDETTANDSDYILTNYLNSTGAYATYCCQLAPPLLPPGPGTHTLRYRVKKNIDSTALIEASPQFFYNGTMIDFEGTWHTLTDSFQTFSWEPDLSVVADWSKLQPLILFQNNGDAVGNHVGGLSWLELELPDPAASGMMLMF